MKKRSLLLAIFLLAATAVAVWYIAFVKEDNHASKNMPTNGSSNSESQGLEVDDRPYSALMGDEFDEAYLASMLAHHEGAVNMSEQAQAATAREEIRILAGNITASQSKEMADMRQWQLEWGYDITNSAGHMSHGGSGTDMAGDMVEMQNSLNGLTGEAFDKEFLRQMILHHEQAIEMSEPAATNANHQEIKELASNVTRTQAAEIEQMKRWKKEWGY